MSEPTYRQALFQAWRLVWHNKILWIFGLLSMLFAGSFGADNFLGKLLASFSGGQATFLANFNLKSLLHLTPASTIGLIWLAGIMLAVGLLVIFISICARTSLLIATAEFYRHKVIPKFSAIWHGSLKHFLKIFIICCKFKDFFPVSLYDFFKNNFFPKKITVSDFVLDVCLLFAITSSFRPTLILDCFCGGFDTKSFFIKSTDFSLV